MRIEPDVTIIQLMPVQKSAQALVFLRSVDMSFRAPPYHSEAGVHSLSLVIQSAAKNLAGAD